MHYRLRTFAESLKQPRNSARILLLALSSILATYLQALYADVWLLYPIVVISTFIPEIIAALTQGETEQPSVRKVAEARANLIKSYTTVCARVCGVQQQRSSDRRVRQSAWQPHDAPDPDCE